jgi:integrase
MIAAYSGLRASELLRLTETSSRAASLAVPTSKTGRPRNVPIVAILRPYLSELPLAFSYRQLVGQFWVARKAAKMEHVHFHDLRHSCASMLINKGVDLYTVGAILGHSSTQTTARYSHLADKTLRAAMRKIG